MMKVVMPDKKKSNKLKGTSLMEVIVGLGLISTIFIIGSRLWISAVVVNHPQKNFALRAYMREWIQQPVSLKTPQETTFEYKGTPCVRKVSYYPGNTRLLIIEIQCSPSEGRKEVRKKIIQANEN